MERNTGQDLSTICHLRTVRQLNQKPSVSDLNYMDKKCDDIINSIIKGNRQQGTYFDKGFTEGIVGACLKTSEHEITLTRTHGNAL